MPFLRQNSSQSGLKVNMEWAWRPSQAVKESKVRKQAVVQGFGHALRSAPILSFDFIRQPEKTIAFNKVEQAEDALRTISCLPAPVFAPMNASRIRMPSKSESLVNPKGRIRDILFFRTRPSPPPFSNYLRKCPYWRQD